MQRVAYVLGILGSLAVMAVGGLLLLMGSEALNHGNRGAWLETFACFELVPAVSLVLCVRRLWIDGKKK